jgi:hypothetical protein
MGMSGLYHRPVYLYKRRTPFAKVCGDFACTPPTIDRSGSFSRPKKPEVVYIELPTWLTSTVYLTVPRIHAFLNVSGFESSLQTSPQDESELPPGNSGLGDQKKREK